MACKEPVRSTNIVIYLGILIVATSFCHGKGVTKLEALDKSVGNLSIHHVKTESHDLRRGRLLVGKNKSQVVRVGQSETVQTLPEVDKHYQADMGWEGSSQPKGQNHGFLEQKQDKAAVEQLLKLDPKVECTKDSMKLQVQDAASYPGSLLFVDRGSQLSPLPLSKLPTSCGYSIQSTRRDLVLVAPYDGCFVSLQEENYVLPLRWWGLPVRMSCPLMRQASSNPPVVTCHAEGMIVKTEWTMPTDKIKVKLSGDWKPLMTASSTCHFGVVAHPEGVVISLRFAPCLQITDGMYTLELSGDGEIKISCPSLPQAGNEQRVTIPQKEVPGKGIHPPAQSQFDAENHAPQTINQPQYPYFPLYPSYVFPANQESTPTEKPLYTIGKPQQPVDPPSKQPIAPKGQDQQSFYQYPYYPQPQPGTKPSKPQAPKGQIQQSLVTQPEPDKPTATQKPSQPTATQGQEYQPYPFYHYPSYSPLEPVKKTASKPTVAPQSQVNQQFYNLPSYPQPEIEKHPEKPIGATSSQQPGAPHGQGQQPEVPQGQGQQQFYFYPYYFHSGQGSTDPSAPNLPQAPQPEAPKGQVQWPFFPKQDHKEPPAKKPVNIQKTSEPEAPPSQVYPKQEPGKPPATKPPQPEAPKGQVHQQLYPQPEPDKQPAAEKPAQSEVHQGLVYPSFYHPYFFNQPKPKNPTGAAETPQSSKPAPSQSPYEVYQYPVYPKPDFEKQPATEHTYPPNPEDKAHEPEPQNKPNGKPTPTSNKQPQVPNYPEYKPFYPYHYPYGYPFSYPYYSLPGPSDQQPAAPIPSSSESELPKPDDQSSKTEGAGQDDNTPVKIPQQQQYPEDVALPPATTINQQPSKGGTYPDNPPSKTPVYCPQYCPSGLSSCCVQIAFHQHLHHILPAKETPQLYPGLPFLPSMFYSGSDQGLVSTPFLQKSTETAAEVSPASSSAFVSSQAPLSVKGNQLFHQPPDGNLEALKGSNPSKSTNQKLIHTVPHPVYPYEPYLLQHEDIKKFPQSQSPAHYIVPYQSQDPSKGQVSQVVQHPETSSKQVSTEQKPSDIKTSDFGAKYPEVVGDPNRNKLLRYLLQNTQGLTNHKQSLQQQPLVGSLQEPNHHPAASANPEPQSYVLLQHGPPGRESYGSNRSPLPFTDLNHDAHHQSYNQQNPENLQQPERLGKGPSPKNVNYMPGSDDRSSSSWHPSAPPGLHFKPLTQDPSFSTGHSNPPFPGWTPGSTGQRVHVHSGTSQQWSPSADEPQNGQYQPNEEGGTNNSWSSA